MESFLLEDTGSFLSIMMRAIFHYNTKENPSPKVRSWVDEQSPRGFHTLWTSNGTVQFHLLRYAASCADLAERTDYG